MAYNPPIGSIYHLYTTYILPSGGLYATYHLLGEPEPTIESWEKVEESLALWAVESRCEELGISADVFFIRSSRSIKVEL